MCEQAEDEDEHADLRAGLNTLCRDVLVICCAEIAERCWSFVAQMPHARASGAFVGGVLFFRGVRARGVGAGFRRPPPRHVGVRSRDDAADGFLIEGVVVLFFCVQ